MNPISSRLSSDHTAQTDAAFSLVMLTVVAAVALLPRVPLFLSLPLFSSPEAFVCLGTSWSRRFPLHEEVTGETSVFVAQINGEVSTY